MNEQDASHAVSPLGPTGHGDLAQWIDPAQPVYALVDPIAGDIGPSAALNLGSEDAVGLIQRREAGWQRPIWLAKTPAAAHLRSSAQPYLVMLSGIDDPWFAYLVELAESELQMASEPGASGVGVHACGGFLQSGVSPESVAEHLAALFSLQAGLDVRASYLRLADRRTFALASYTVDSQDFARALGPISQWVYLGVLGRWCRARSSSPAQALRFAPDQWRQMELGALIHPPISRLLGDPGQCAALSTGDESRMLQQALSAARHALNWQSERRCSDWNEADLRDLTFRLLKYSGAQNFDQTLSMVETLAASNGTTSLQEQLLELDEQMAAQAELLQ